MLLEVIVLIIVNILVINQDIITLIIILKKILVSLLVLKALQYLFNHQMIHNVV